MSILKELLGIPEKPREGAECILFTGLPGGGKSLVEVLEFALAHLLAGEEVYACCWINWAGKNFHYFPPTEEGFNSIKDVRNAVVMFDELAQIWDPRNYGQESREVRAFFQLHRHRHIDIAGNTQDVSLIAKTVGIVGSEFIQVERLRDSWVMELIRDLLGLERRIGVIKRYMSLKELKKESYGFDLEYTIEERGDKEVCWYKMSDIIRADLNDYKVETVHRYCPKCCSRQGEQIKKEDNDKWVEWIQYDERKPQKGGYFKLIKAEYCPKHKDQELEIRETGLYDTDYEPEIIEQEFIYKKFKKCDCGFDHLVK